MGWLKVSDQTILTLHKRVITHNSRIRVTHDEQRTWNLLIKNVQPEDEGCYMCQINTAVMKKELGCISVLGNQLGIHNEPLLGKSQRQRNCRFLVK